MRICLSILNGDGISVYIENKNGDELRVSERYRCGTTPRQVVRSIESAAKQLREVALRLEFLAQQPNPFNATTQTQVNRIPVSKLTETRSEDNQ